MTGYADGVTIKVNGSPVAISDAQRQADHAVVHYTIPAVISTDVITWEYSKTSGSIASENDNTPLEDVTAQTVTNNVPPAGPPLADQLVGYWPMDEASGDMLDITGGGKTFARLGPEIGSNTGLVYATAREFTGGVLQEFARLNSDVRFGDVDFMIAAWWYQYTTPDGSFPNLYHYILRNDTFSGGHSIGLNGADQIFFQCGYGGGGIDTLHHNIPGTVNNVWHLGVCWYTAADNTMHVSIDNGTPSTQVMTAAKEAGDQYVIIGSDDGSGSNTMNGRIGPLMMWDRVLSEDDLTLLYNGGNGLTYAEML